jgi:hypothetical protein
MNGQMQEKYLPMQELPDGVRIRGEDQNPPPTPDRSGFLNPVDGVE